MTLFYNTDGLQIPQAEHTKIPGLTLIVKLIVLEGFAGVISSEKLVLPKSSGESQHECQKIILPWISWKTLVDIFLFKLQ